jgi:hypothetical protein
VLLEGKEGRGEVFLFSGDKVKLKKLSTRALVAVEPPTEDTAPEVMYEEKLGLVAIAKIQLENRTLRFPRELLQGEPSIITHGGAPAFRLEAGKGWLAVISLVEYKGEPAFRFPVIHITFNLCEGFLYVTAARVAYDPIFTPGRDHGFEASRDDIKEVRHAKKRGANYLEVELMNRELSFRPLYERGENRRPSFSMKKGRKADWEFWELFLRAFNDIRAVEASLKPTGM